MNNISIYTRFGKTIKKLFGIKDISLLKKDIHKRVGKLFFHRKYDSNDITSVMKMMGVGQGSVVCIHSSMKEFYNFRGTADELISSIIDLIGVEGTLLMPAFPSKTLTNRPDYVFNVLEDATGAGYLAESFRKYPGVKRSINVEHSVCAIGKYADYLIKDHQFTHDCWDKDSPWQRMIELDAIVINFGMPDFYIGTFEHCVESILQYEHPYWAQFFTKEKQFKYYDALGKVRTYTNYTCEIDRRTRERRVYKFFTEKEMMKYRLSNLLIKGFLTKPCLAKMLELGRRGIGIYYVPNPHKYVF